MEPKESRTSGLEHQEFRPSGLEPIAISGPQYPIAEAKGIVFEGGGVLGIGHVGALDELNKTRPLAGFTHFAGSSAGAIIAMALACGATVDYIKGMLETTNFTEFNDSSWLCVQNIARALKVYGWYKGQTLEDWLGSNLKTLTGDSEITLAQHYKKFGTYLLVTMTLVEYPDCKTVYADYITHPNLPVKVAVRRSISIPGYFASMPAKPEYGDPKGIVYVDGGLLDNYPIEQLYSKLPKEQVIGIKLISKVKIHHSAKCDSRPVSGPVEFAEVIITSLRNQALQLHIEPDDWARTIKVDVGTISAFNFNLTEKEKTYLFSQGQKAAGQYLSGTT